MGEEHQEGQESSSGVNRERIKKRLGKKNKKETRKKKEKKTRSGFNFGLGFSVLQFENFKKTPLIMVSS